MKKGAELRPDTSRLLQGGVLGFDRLASLYGIDVADNNLAILMRQPSVSTTMPFEKS